MPAVSFGLPLLPPLSHSFPGFLPEESNLQRLSQHRQRICGKPTTSPPPSAAWTRLSAVPEVVLTASEYGKLHARQLRLYGELGADAYKNAHWIPCHRYVNALEYSSVTTW